jgi:DNA modification methylase
LYATLNGRSVNGEELESKFVKMAQDNLEKLSQMPLQLGVKQRGKAQIIQGDARQLEGLLVDKCIFSPPYAEARPAAGDQRTKRVEAMRRAGYSEKAIKNVMAKLGGDYSCATLDDYNPDNPNNIGNLPYGAIDKIVTSPPYAEGVGALPAKEKFYNHPTQKKIHRYSDTKSSGGNYGKAEGQIGNLPYGEIDKIITSPPYEGSLSKEADGTARINWTKAHKSHWQETGHSYSASEDNIGNLKSDTYLQAMLQVYQQCWKVLKRQGLLILVTKNFIRNKQIVRLDLDTIKLCEQAGFGFVERHYRKLPAQSFWRVIYYKKHPDVPVIDKEDILVFTKGEGDERFSTNCH